MHCCVPLLLWDLRLRVCIFFGLPTVLGQPQMHPARTAPAAPTDTHAALSIPCWWTVCNSRRPGPSVSASTRPRSDRGRRSSTLASWIRGL
ncbi:hypothetical protein V8E36_008423 [Tilletia maclaganii]